MWAETPKNAEMDNAMEPMNVERDGKAAPDMDAVRRQPVTVQEGSRGPQQRASALR